MSKQGSTRRRLLIVGGLTTALVIVLAFSLLLYSIRRAESSARAFCGDIAVGADISKAVERAGKEGILYGSNGGYDFYFPTITGFDKAVCSVSVDGNGVVVSTSWEMRYD